MGFDVQEYRKNRANQEKEVTKQGGGFDVQTYRRQKQAPQVGEDITNRVNTWLKDNEFFINTYNQRNASPSSYRADTADWLSKATSRTKALGSEANDIRAILADYADFYDPKWVNSINSVLDSSTSLYDKILSASTKDHEYWSQWADEDSYKKAMAGWLNENAEVDEESIEQRRARYQSNADRIAELEKKYKTTGIGFVDDTINAIRNTDWTSGHVSNAYEDDLRLLDELKAENLRYEREQKVLDDYYVPETEEFLQNAAFRDYANPTLDDVEAYFKSTDLAPTAPTDKLGFYLNGYIPLQEELLARQDIARNTGEDYRISIPAEYTALYHEGRDGSWEELREREKNIYYDLLKREGQESAYEFLDAMQTILNKRATQAMAQQVADAGVGAQIAYNVASIPANVLGGAGSFVDDAIHMIKGEDINPYSYAHRWQNFAQAVRQDTAQDINKLTGNVALPYVGTTFGDVYQALMSGVDSAVGIGLGGTTYGILMGMDAASSEAKELYEKGASMGQIAAGGILAGAAEMVFEKYSIDKFVKMGDAKTVATIFVNALKQGGVEASEEVLTEIANTLSDAVVMGSQSDWQGYIDKYIAEGYSESEATVKALFNDVAPNVINAGIGGLISGGAMGSLGSTGSYFNYQNRLKSHGQSIIDRGGVDTVKALADDMAGVKAVSKASSKVGSKASAKNVGGLSVAIEEAMSAQNKADIESALVEKGLSKSEAKRVTAYLTSTAELTEEQQSEIKNNKQIAEVVKELFNNSKSTLNQRKLNLLAARLGVKLNDKKATTAGEVAVNKELNLKDKISAKKQTTNEATGEAIVIDKNNAIAKVEDGKVYYNTDKGVVPLTDVTYASEEEGVLYEGLSDLNPAIANALISNYDGKISARAYVNGAREGILLYGKNNFQAVGKDIPTDTYFADLSEADQAFALKLGKTYSKMEAEQKGENLKTAIKNAAERAEADKASGKQIAEGKIRFESNVDGGKLNRTQRRTVSLAKPLAKAIGIDIVFYDATKAGTKHNDSNGYFDRKDNSIHLDLQNAVTDSKTIAFTLSHELVHFIKKWSPAKFKAFADFLMEQYAVHGVSTSTLLANKMAALNTTDADYAYEEMIADACERMLLDSNAVVKLMELRKSDLELFEKVKLHILQLLNKIRNAFKGVDPNTEEGIALQKMEDVLGKLHEMFEDAALDAAKTYGEASKYGAREVYREARGLEIGSRSLEELSEAQNTEGEPLFQYKAIQADEKAYRTMLTKWGKMTDVQIDNLFATIDTAIELIKDNLEALDYAWEADIDDRAFSPVKANSDKLYKVSLDFSTLCRKRLLQQTVQVQLQEALNQPLTKEEGIAIRDALIAIQEEGRQIEVACALCYVESARMKSPEQIKKFINNREQVIKEFFAGKSGGTMKEKIAKAEADARETLAKENPNGIKGKDGKTMVDPLTAKLKELPKKYADVIRDAKREARASYNPTPEEQKLIDVAMDMTVSDFTSPKGLENLAKNYPALFDAYTSYVRNATKSKGIEGDVWWRAGDSKKIGDVLIATMNKENGLRSQSWSDFQVVHILDYIAATIELATREAKEQAYTKVPDFAELMGKTGVMINLSLIPTAKFSGKLEYDGVEGMAYKRALELRDKYPDTVGTICIGISNEQIKMLLADMTIDYVIPYHKSGMSAVIRKAMHIPTWEQYEDYQGEKELSRTEAQKRADKYGVKLLAENDPNYHKGTSFSEWFDLKEAQQIAKKENAKPSDKAKQKEYGIMYGGYMAMQNAAQNYLKLCAERGLAPKFSHEKADFTAEDNYWKLLIDRKMVNNVTGAVIEQQTIKPIFEESEIMRILNDELKRYPKVKEDQEYAIRRVTEAYLSGNLKGGMSAEAIAKVMKKPVDNVTNVNILASAEEIDEGIKKQVKRATDKDYLDAVNRGDMETAQRMVDEAAMAAGYDTKAYHGTPNGGFTVFGGKKTRNGAPPAGSSWFSVSEEHSRNEYAHYVEWGKQAENPIVYSVWLMLGRNVDIGNGRVEALDYEIDGKGAPSADLKRVARAITRSKLYYVSELDYEAKYRYNLNKLTQIARDNYADFVWQMTETKEFANLCKDNHIDSVTAYEEGARDKDGNRPMIKTYGVFYPDQIKSADPVTYDDEGNVIPLSERFNAKNDDIRYQKKPTTNRTLLANALESAAQNDIERNKLAQYKSKIDLIESEQAKLAEVRAKANELRRTKGKTPEETKEMKALDFEAIQIANRINTYDRQLLNLESTLALKNVLQREKEQARKREAQKGKEALAAYKEKSADKTRELMNRYQESRKRGIESRSKTKLKGDTRKLVRNLTSLLKNGNKKRNIKEDEQGVVASALALAEILLADDITNEDIVTIGVDDALDSESVLLNEYRDLITQRDDYLAEIDSYNANGVVNESDEGKMSNARDEVEKIKRRISELNRELASVFERERTRLNRSTIDNMINNLIAEYSVLAKSDKAYIKNAYREEVKDRLTILKTSLGNKIVRDMDIYQLTELYDTLKMIEKMVRVSNKLFIDGKLEDLKSKVSAVEDEVMSATDTPKEYGTVVSTLESAFREFSWNNLRPIDAFERLGSPTLEKLFWDFVDGMTKAGQIIRETGEAIYEARTKYGYSKWKLNEVSKTFTTRDGLVFKPTLADKLSIYAYSQREQAEKHMLDGGFVFDTGATYKEVENGKTYVRKKLSQTYRMDDITIGSIIASLTQEQRDYVDAILPIFTALGEMGNEVSDVMYGIDLFKEKVYFPLETSADYRSSTSETLNSTPTMSSMTNSGFTKQTVPNADNAIVLRAFDDVTLEHIEKMANWVSLVLPIENLRKVFENVSREEDRNSKSIKSLIGERYGVEAQKYFEQWITDINGGVVPQGAKSFLGKMFSRAKAMSVSANLSVVAQQYSSIFRAMELVDPKYFTPFINKEARVSDKKAYDELIKYAPITIIKEMGGFDVGSGHNAKSYIGDKGARMDAKHIGRKIGDVSMWGASLMDKLGWVTIWKAIKAEVAKEQKLKVGTDEFFEACKKRFTEVIVKTQVFDSVASRSGYMRSQNDLVKFSTSFLGEPTAIMGRMFVSTHNLVRAIKSGDKAEIKSAAAHFGRTMGVIAVSGTLANLAKALIYAGRDDDEDKAFIEKWSSNFAEALESDLNPLNSLPFTRDIMSAIEGWDVERPDMTLIAELVTSIKRMLDGEPTLDDSLNLTGSVGNFFGIPLKNVIREIKSVITVVDDIFDDVKPTDVSGAFIEGITGKKRSTTELLYRAMVNKDKGKVNAIRSGYKTESAYLTALRTALRENDPRIAEAAKARINGNIAEYTRIARLIIAEGNFSQDIIVGAINNSEINAIKASEPSETTEVKAEKALTIYSANDINLAFDNDNNALAKSIIKELIDTKVANGMEEKNAKSSVRSSMTSYWKPLVIEAYKSKNASEKIRIRDLLYETGLYGKTRKEVKEAMDKWYDDYLKE